MEVGAQVLHPVLGRGTVVYDDGLLYTVVIKFNKPIPEWGNPIELKEIENLKEKEGRQGVFKRCV